MKTTAAFPGENIDDIAKSEVLSRLHQSSKDGAIGLEDSRVFNDAIKNVEDLKIQDISVGEPAEIGGLVKYKVRGFDG